MEQANRVKILLLDIETAPNLAYVWRFWDERIGPQQVVEHCSLLSFAAKWYYGNGKGMMFYQDVYKSDEKTLLKALNNMLNEADATVTHNGARFDMPKIRGRSLVHGLKPPSPVKEIDTYLICRKEFGFDANSLEYMAKVLKLKHQKLKHKKFPGFELWLECLRGNPVAWAELKRYNIHDVKVLEELYEKVLPWARQHPSVAVYAEDTDLQRPKCPKCGGKRLQRRGWAYTNVGKYRRYQCGDCGGWSRGRHTEYPKELRKNLTVNVVS